MSPEAAARRSKVRRRDARLARAELEAGGLSRHDQRRLRTIIRTRELASRHRCQELRHLMTALLSGVAAMAVVGAALGLVPAIEAASGNGVIGTFVASFPSCSPHRGPCVWVGTFEARGGDVVHDVVYEGSLAPGIGGGSRVPARYPGGKQAYAVHGSHSWAWDLLIILFVGSLVGLLVWLMPVGLRHRRAGSAAWRRRMPPKAQL